MGNFPWDSFDLLDGNCLPGGNLKPGHGEGEDGGSLALDIRAGSSKELQGAGISCGRE